MYVCDTEAQKAGLCTEAELGQALIDTSVESTVRSKTLDFTDEAKNGIQFVNYPIHKTGYYCIFAWPLQINQADAQFSGVLDFNNNYGRLAGADFPKLPVMTMALTRDITEQIP